MLPWPLSVGDKLGPEEILSPSAAAGWAETFPPRANFAEIRGWWWSSPGSSPGGCYCPTVIVAAGLAMPPTVTTTGYTPSGALGGITKLICVAPARPDGMPAKAICAGTTPTVTVTGNVGCGRWLRGVAMKGDAPVGSAGETWPSPVMKMSSVSPRLPLEYGTSADGWLGSVKMPGADAATVKTYDATCPLLFTPTTAGTIPVS